MTETPSKKAQRSPNYPQNPLKWAIDNGLALLEKEKLHPVPLEIIAKNLGYKDANNGAARRALANLKAFGVVQKASGGKLQVSPDIQRYKLTPNENDKVIYLKQWLKKPLLYSKLLDKYKDNLPSDRALVFELVDEHGFNESAAQSAIDVFRASLKYVEQLAGVLGNSEDSENDLTDDPQDDAGAEASESFESRIPPPPLTPPPNPTPPLTKEGVRYPIILEGGRMAWIEVPDPFYDADKARLKAQLDIIVTVDEDNEFGELDM